MLGRLLLCAAVAAWVTGCSCASDTDPAIGDDGGPPPDGTIGDVDAGPLPDGATPDTGTCVDADGDGVDSCSDCDDADPNTYPGAPEQCGDGVTNDCSGNPPDTGCMGLGTYVAPPPLGDPANPGTQAAPVDTINQGLMNAMTIGGGVDVFVAAGTYAEDITMSDGISILGGHDPAAGWARDPVANVSVIDATTAAGVTVVAAVTDITLLDGFTINGLSGGSSSAAITLVRRASPTISNNVINAGNTGGSSIGIDVNPANMRANGAAVISGNEINMGQSRGGWGANTGALGIRAQQVAVTVRNNRINLASDDTIQTAVLVVNSPATSTVDGNVIRGTGNADFAFGMRVPNSEIVVSNNDVDPGSCFQGCRGIATGGQGVTQRFENNVVFGGNGRMRTVAFAVEYEVMVPSPVPEIIVHSNFFHGGSGSGTTMGVSLGECPSAAFSVGRFYNNVMYSGAGSDRWAFSEDHGNIDPVALENNALYFMPGGGNGGLYRDEGNPAAVGCVPGGSGNDITAIANVNALTGASGNIDDDCSVTNPTVGGDFHLMAGSACIDAGSTAGMPPATDFEGDARPSGAGPDIGPDET